MNPLFSSDAKSSNTPLSYWILDRFEDNEALLIHDTGSWASVNRANLPPECREGDCLQMERDIWTIDSEETARRKGDMRMRLQRLFRRNPEEDRW